MHHDTATLSLPILELVFRQPGRGCHRPVALAYPCCFVALRSLPSPPLPCRSRASWLSAVAACLFPGRDSSRQDAEHRHPQPRRYCGPHHLLHDSSVFALRALKYHRRRRRCRSRRRRLTLLATSVAGAPPIRFRGNTFRSENAGHVLSIANARVISNSRTAPKLPSDLSATRASLPFSPSPALALSIYPPLAVNRSLVRAPSHLPHSAAKACGIANAAKVAHHEPSSGPRGKDAIHQNHR